MAAKKNAQKQAKPAKKDLSNIVGPSYFKDICGYSESYVHRLAREKVLIKVGHGKYNRDASLKNIFENDKDNNKTVKDKDGREFNFALERARKMAADADAQERKNKKESGELVPLDEIQAEISDAVGICTKIIGSFKVQLQRIAPQLPNRALELIEKEQVKMIDALIELDEDYQLRIIE